MKNLNALYLQNDSAIDTTIFKKCYTAKTSEEAIKLFDDNEIAFVICDLECVNADKFIKHVTEKYAFFPVLILEKTPKISYDFDFFIKIRKPFNLDGFRKKVLEKEKDIIEYFEKNVQENMSVADSIMLFFTDKNAAIEEMMSSTNISKEMDFDMLRNFIYTAYNNFVFIDKKIDKGELKKTKENFEKIQWMYKNLLKSTDKGIRELYKLIFLYNFYDYKKVNTQLENGKKTIIELQKKIQRINDRNQMIQKEIELGASDIDKESLEKEKKSLKGSYTDVVHNISLIQEQNHELVKELGTIEDAYFEEFQEEFDKQKVEINKKYKNLLNKFTFFFNRQLWLAAKKSKVILDYFENGQIDGILNSRTYLEHYLSHVDTTKASEKTKKMVKYLEQYNIYNKINVAFLTTNEDLFFEYGNIMKKIDSSVYPYQYTRIDRFIKEYPKHNFEILLIDYQSQIIKSTKVLKLLKDKLPDNLIITTIASSNPDKNVVYKNFSDLNKKRFQQEFKLVL